MNLSMKVTWWDVTETMTLNEIQEYCDENDVRAQVQDGRVCVPVFEIVEEGEEA